MYKRTPVVRAKPVLKLLMRYLTTIILAALIGGSGAYAWLYYGGFEGERATAVAFIDVYGDYREVVTRVETLTHIPGVESNPDREELERLLTRILTEQVTDEDRERLARLAFSNLDVLKREVDAAQAAQAALYATLQDLDNASRAFSGIEVRNQAQELVHLARKRAELTARITSIQAETHEHAYAIITKVLADGGALSDNHKREINAATAVAEARHSTLTTLHQELGEHTARFDALFKVFVETAV